MKKFLSLVMALIMVMSLVTVASAADYKDAADIDKAQAVDVMSAVGVFQGSAGKFNPKAILNRAEAAKLIAYLDLGEDVAEALPAVQSFSDVPTTHWAAKFIAYCADEGYINGVGNGKFDPAGKLTGYQFGKLLLCVLGYDYKLESFTGANWTIAVAKLMQANDINKDVKAVPSADLTREDAAQYCLNALKATTVGYADKGTTITVGGVDIVTGAKAATVKTTSTGDSYAAAIDNDTVNGDYTIELGEKLYEGDLVLSEANDAFGRKADVWTYENETVGTYANVAKVVFTSKKTEAEVATAMKGLKIDGYKIDADTKTLGDDAIGVTGMANWDHTKSTAKIVAEMTANNKVVEIYSSKGNVNKVLTLTYGVAEVYAVHTNKDGDVTYTLKTAAGGMLTPVDKADPDKKDTISFKTAPVKKDVVTYFVGRDAVTYVYPTTSITGVVTAMKDADYVTVDGVKYPVAPGASVDVKKDAQELTIDQFGIVVDGDDVDKDSDVVYVAYTWAKAGAYGYVNMAQVVDQAGKVTEVEVDDETPVSKGAYTYYMSSDDTAVFSTPASKEAGKIYRANSLTNHIKDTDKKLQTVASYAEDSSYYYYFASDVTFVNVKDPGAKIKVTTSTGTQDIDYSVARDSYVVMKDGEIITVFVAGEKSAVANKDDVLFMADTYSYSNAADAKGNKAAVYNVYKDGEKMDIMVKSGNREIAFFTYSVDESTGKYNLTKVVSGAYSCTVDGTTLNIASKKYVNLGDGVTDAVLASDCEFYDTTGNNIVDLETLVTFVESNSGSSFILHALYDSKEEEITCIYLI